MIVTQKYTACDLIGFCTEIAVRVFKPLFSTSIFGGYLKLMMPYMIFDNCSCQFNELCSGNGRLSPVAQNQSSIVVSDLLKEAQGVDQAAVKNCRLSMMLCHMSHTECPKSTRHIQKTCSRVEQKNSYMFVAI